MEIGADPANPVDTDGDLIPDFLDLDSDNDGLTDLFEAGGTDADNNGIVDNFVDANGDGMDDAVFALPLALGDFDGDGIPDYLDLDSDNDGLSDLFETTGTQFDADGDGAIDDIVDLDLNGLSDVADINAVVDTDINGFANHLDLDSDGDGASDLAEVGGDDINGDGLVDSFTDSDGDGVQDNIDVDLTGGADADGDGIDDIADADFSNLPDSDSDGIIDLFDDDFVLFGFAPFTTNGEVVPTTELVDSDGELLSSVLDADVVTVAEPEVASAFGGGSIFSGLSGRGGCSIGGDQRDPTLPMLAFASLLLMGSRVRRKRTQPIKK